MNLSRLAPSPPPPPQRLPAPLPGGTGTRVAGGGRGQRGSPAASFSPRRHSQSWSCLQEMGVCVHVHVCLCTCIRVLVCARAFLCSVTLEVKLCASQTGASLLALPISHNLQAEAAFRWLGNGHRSGFVSQSRVQSPTTLFLLCFTCVSFTSQGVCPSRQILLL